MKQQLYVIIKVGIQLRSVLQSNGQDSTPAICSQQYLGLAVCAYTVPMPYPVCNTEPHCTTYHLQPCFVIWMQKASATTQTFGGGQLCVP